MSELLSEDASVQWQAYVNEVRESLEKKSEVHVNQTASEGKGFTEEASELTEQQLAPDEAPWLAIYRRTGQLRCTLSVSPISCPSQIVGDS